MDELGVTWEHIETADASIIRLTFSTLGAGALFSVDMNYEFAHNMIAAGVQNLKQFVDFIPSDLSTLGYPTGG